MHGSHSSNILLDLLGIYYWSDEPGPHMDKMDKIMTVAINQDPEKVHFFPITTHLLVQAIVVGVVAGVQVQHMCQKYRSKYILWGKLWVIFSIEFYRVT